MHMRLLAALLTEHISSLEVILQDMGMLGHHVEVPPWNGGAVPVGMPFYNDDNMRLVLNVDSQF